MEDAPEVFDPNDSGYLDPLEEPGVAKFAKLICGRDVVHDDAEKDEPDSEELPPKMLCNKVIYYILANENPEEYPLMDDDKPISAHTSEDGACSIIEEGKVVETVKDCSCSPPQEYNFVDKGRFKIWKDWIDDNQLF